MRLRFPALYLLLSLINLAPWHARAGEEADALLRLTPPDAGATVIIEDLRGHARRFFDSPLGAGLSDLPAVRAWRGSERFQGFQLARQQIEKAIGENVTAVRDDLLGDAVVLAIHLAPDQAPDQARGLLLTRIRNQTLLDRSIQVFNSAQTQKGEIARVESKQWHNNKYSSRVFHDPNRPTEYYAILNRTFAWSNSEDLLRGVIECQSGTRPGLSAEPRFQRVRSKLPATAALRLFLDPAFLRRVLATAPRQKTSTDDERIVAWFERYLAAVEYAGAALEWREGIILQTEEMLDPERLDPGLKSWAAGPGARDVVPQRVPAQTLAMASLSANFPALFQVVESLVSDDVRAKSENMLEVLKGVLLGRDFRTEVLPHLGPEVLAYVEAPNESSKEHRLPFVLSFNVGGDSQVGAALGNALRTFLAIYALDDKHGKGRLKLESREIDGVKVLALGPVSPYAFALSGGRLVLGSSPEAVARAFSPGGNAELEALRASYFPMASSFACVDLAALRAVAVAQHATLVKHLSARNHLPEATEARDMDQVIALIALFRGAYLTSEMTPDASSVHRTLGFIAREQSSKHD